jgi:lipopolysaccharide transport system ATP-binding protein
MKRAEIRRRFDEIVEFSGISRYLDTPVKRYSSGMRVRLGFAVAAHLDLDILLVDEVLAVGDVAFQQKCLGKMNEVASRGRTVVFVSHNTSAVNRLCTRAVYLRGGRLVDDGSPVDVTAKYLNENSAGQGERTWPDADTAPGSDTARVRAVRLISEDCVVAAVHIDKAASIEVDFQIRRRGNRTLMVAIYVTDAAGAVAFSTANVPGANLLPDDWFDHEHDPGTYRATCTIPPQFLNDVRYYVGVHLVSHDAGTIEANAERAIAFDVVDTGVMRDNDREWHGAVRPRFLWTTRALGSLDMDVSSINSEPARFNPAAQ